METTHGPTLIAMALLDGDRHRECLYAVSGKSSITEGKHQQAVYQRLLSRECFHLFVQLQPSVYPAQCLVCWISVSASACLTVLSMHAPLLHFFSCPCIQPSVLLSVWWCYMYKTVRVGFQAWLYSLKLHTLLIVFRSSRVFGCSKLAHSHPTIYCIHPVIHVVLLVGY